MIQRLVSISMPRYIPLTCVFERYLFVIVLLCFCYCCSFLFLRESTSKRVRLPGCQPGTQPVGSAVLHTVGTFCASSARAKWRLVCSQRN